MNPTILLTGASGFVGTATRRALLRHGHTDVRILARSRPVDDPAGADVVHCDLADPASLAGVCDGVGTVLHLASYIGPDEEACAAVNERGTRALVEEARRAGVRRIVYLSTAAVYGTGPHRGPAEYDLIPAPVSATSRTRLAGEVAVREAGGVVLRPHFVYGEGDTWFVPAIAALLRRVPVRLNGGRARLSVIAVDDLAEVAAVLALTPWEPGPGQVYHVCEPRPVRLREITDAVGGALGLRTPRASLPLWLVTRLARATPAEAHQLALVARDHHYDSSRIWQRTGLRPGPPFPGRFPDYAPWYRATAAPPPD